MNKNALKSNTPRSIGIFGGTFDPIHYGHLRIALECKEALKLDELRMIPCARPPHRAHPAGSAEQRLAMLQVALENSDHIIADDRELRRSGLSYTVDTLQSFKYDYPQSALYLILGSDSFQSLPTWHNWGRILELANIVIAKRPDSGDDRLSDTGKILSDHFIEDLESYQGSLFGKIFQLKVSQLEISSTRVRDLVADNKSPQYLLPEAVIKYIKSNLLYKERD